MSRSSRQDLKAMILAAGRGTRMRPLSDSVPKALVPLGGRPLIHHPLRWLKSQGLCEVVINTHHLGEAIMRELGDGGGLGMKIHYSPETKLLGTGGGVARAMKTFGPGRLVLINSDTLIDASLDDLLARHGEARAVATLVVIPEREPSVFTRLLCDEQQLLRAIGKNPELDRGLAQTLTAATYTGLCLLEPELIQRLPADRPACLVRDALIPALVRGDPVAVLFHRGYWNGLDTLERVKRAEADIKSGAFTPP